MGIISIELSQLPSKMSRLSEVEKLAGVTALNRVAFNARKKVMINMESKFMIEIGRASCRERV